MQQIQYRNPPQESMSETYSKNLAIQKPELYYLCKPKGEPLKKLWLLQIAKLLKRVQASSKIQSSRFKHHWNRIPGCATYQQWRDVEETLASDCKPRAPKLPTIRRSLYTRAFDERESRAVQTIENREPCKNSTFSRLQS